MRRIPVTRKDLPYLEVESIEAGPLVVPKDGQPGYRLWRIHGTISDPAIVDPTAWCALLGPKRDCLYGDWSAQPDNDGRVAFETGFETTGIEIGTHLPFAGQRDVRAAILIEDGPSAWQESRFIAKDAVATRFADSEGKYWQKLEELKADNLPEPDSHIVTGGWDHEHCLLCNEHIDPGDRFYRHSSENESLCVACYEKHASIGDLSFLTTNDQEATASDQS